MILLSAVSFGAKAGMTCEQAKHFKYKFSTQEVYKIKQFQRNEKEYFQVRGNDNYRSAAEIADTVRISKQMDVLSKACDIDNLTEDQYLELIGVK